MHSDSVSVKSTFMHRLSKPKPEIRMVPTIHEKGSDNACVDFVDFGSPIKNGHSHYALTKWVWPSGDA
jgi:hypothetical protein